MENESFEGPPVPAHILDLIAAGVGRANVGRPSSKGKPSKAFMNGCLVIKGKRIRKCDGCGPSNCPMASNRGKLKLDLDAVEFFRKHPEELALWWLKRTFPGIFPGSER